MAAEAIGRIPPCPIITVSLASSWRVALFADLLRFLPQLNRSHRLYISSSVWCDRNKGCVEVG